MMGASSTCKDDPEGITTFEIRLYDVPLFTRNTLTAQELYESTLEILIPFATPVPTTPE
jgi:hypothetical protein